MKFRFTLFLIVSVFAFLLGACSTNSPTVTTSKLGVRVETQGGAYTNVVPIELQQMLLDKNFSLINVHTPYEGEIEKTDAFIPYDEIEKNLNRLPTDKNAMVVLYCRSGHMSKNTAEALVKQGYTNVWNLDRGMIGWEQAGYLILQKNQDP